MSLHPMTGLGKPWLGRITVRREVGAAVISGWMGDPAYGVLSRYGVKCDHACSKSGTQVPVIERRKPVDGRTYIFRLVIHVVMPGSFDDVEILILRGG